MFLQFLGINFKKYRDWNRVLLSSVLFQKVPNVVLSVLFGKSICTVITGPAPE